MTLRKVYSPGVANTLSELEFDDLGFELDDEQYKTGISLLNTFEMYIRSSKVSRPFSHLF